LFSADGQVDNTDSYYISVSDNVETVDTVISYIVGIRLNWTFKPDRVYKP